MLLLTLVFDSFIVGYGIVAYNPDHFLGILLGRAPIEDFGYTIAAFMVVPYLWRIFEKK
jgi:lycopene cyclase domain-containing protein